MLTRQRALHRELRELLQDARKAPAACCGLASAGGSWPSLPSRDMCACGSAAGKDGLLAAATAAAGERYARDEWCTGEPPPAHARRWVRLRCTCHLGCWGLCFWHRAACSRQQLQTC